MAWAQRILTDVDGLRQVFDEADFRKIGSDNARALLPRLRPA